MDLDALMSCCLRVTHLGNGVGLVDEGVNEVARALGPRDHRTDGVASGLHGLLTSFGFVFVGRARHQKKQKRER